MLPEYLTGPSPQRNFPPIPVSLSAKKDIHDLFNTQPMTNKRNRTYLCSAFPPLSTAAAELFDGDVIVELGCGEGNALKELAYIFPDAQLLGVDLNPVDSGRHFLHVDYLQGDIEDDVLWQKLPEQIDFVRSCFAGMYTKDPFALLVRAQKKLADHGKAFLHLGYLEQYGGGEAMIRQQLDSLSPDKIIIGEPFQPPLYYTPGGTDDRMAKHNLRTSCHPVLVTITKDDDLSSLQPIQAKKGVYVTHGGAPYMLPYSDLWYRYSL